MMKDQASLASLLTRPAAGEQESSEQRAAAAAAVYGIHLGESR
jgi:hypothetical protein